MAGTRAKKAPQPEPDSTVRFKLEGDTYEIDPEHLKFGEVEELEVYFAQAYDEIDFESMRGVMFLVYLARKRVEPTFTLDEMRDIEIGQLEDGDKAPPTVASAPANSGSPS